MRYAVYVATTLITEICVGVDVARALDPPRKNDGIELVFHHLVVDDEIDGEKIMECESRTPRGFYCSQKSVVIAIIVTRCIRLQNSV